MSRQAVAKKNLQIMGFSDPTEDQIAGYCNDWTDERIREYGEDRKHHARSHLQGAFMLLYSIENQLDSYNDHKIAINGGVNRPNLTDDMRSVVKDMRLLIKIALVDIDDDLPAGEVCHERLQDADV